MPVKHARTPLLDIGLEEGGPPTGPVVVLLHGWPDDATTWGSVAALMQARGLRTIAPFWRGFGPTRFLDAHTERTGDTARLAADTVDLLDALGIESCMVAGHDWGSSAAAALAVGWPNRIRRIAMLSSRPGIGGLPTPGFEQAQRYWYHWFQVTRRGEAAIRADPKGFARVQWDNWSPEGWYEEATFQAVAKSFDNPDWIDVTLHSYRTRWEEREPDAGSAWLAGQVKETKTVATPALYLQGLEDGVNPPELSADVHKSFSGPFRRLDLPGVGHFPTREAPLDVAKALSDFFLEA